MIQVDTQAGFSVLLFPTKGSSGLGKVSSAIVRDAISRATRGVGGQAYESFAAVVFRHRSSGDHG